MKIFNTLTLVFICSFIFAQSFSLEDVMSAPYCSDLVSADSGNAIAWVSNEKGTRILYQAKLPDLSPRKIFTSKGDDGQVISNISFSADEKYLFFVVGSAPNRNGEIANPASLVPYPKRWLMKYDLGTSALDSIGNYGNYVLSRDNQSLYLPMGNSLLSCDLNSKKKTTVLTMRGAIVNLQCSPKDDAIAFTSNRGDHSFIGVFHKDADRIDWLAPSVDQDMFPQWSPNGDKIAWIRIPGLKKGELFNLTGGTSFKIIIYDLKSGTYEEVWSSPSDDGGFAQYYPAHPLRWAASGDILFYSEHKGWMKIYALSPESKEVRSIIDGNCEVEQSEVTPSGNAVVFSHNCNDLNDRDISVYDLKSNMINNEVTGPQISTDPVILSDGTIVYRRGGHNLVTAIAQVGPGINRIIYPTTINQSFPKSALIQPENVLFSAADGIEVHGQLFVKDKTGKKPAVIFMHGGPIRQMLPGVHYSSYYANAYLMNQYLADQGYVVLSVNFRAGIGYGKDFRRAGNQGPRGASEYQDIYAGGKFLQSLEFVNTQKIGLWGGSYGGLLTAQGLARDSDLFKAGVDFHGVHDWAWRAKDFSPGGAWGITEALMDMAFNSSPVAEIDGWKSPVLLIHGDDDRNVMFGQTTDLVRQLREHDVYHEILVLPDEVHGFYRWQSWVDAYSATIDFFNRFLK